MREYKITIEINAEGQISADADGFAGDACLRDLERLLDGLAPGIPSVDRKAEAGGVWQTKTNFQTLGWKP